MNQVIKECLPYKNKGLHIFFIFNDSNSFMGIREKFMMDDNFLKKLLST